MEEGRREEGVRKGFGRGYEGKRGRKGSEEGRRDDGGGGLEDGRRVRKRRGLLPSSGGGMNEVDKWLPQ